MVKFWTAIDMKYLNHDTIKAKRISIVGCSGSGKSTLTRFMSKTLDIPAYHIDLLFWKSGWVQNTQADLRSKLKPIVNQNEWILDGTFDSSLALRLPNTDLLILLDLPRLICLCRAILRVFKYSKVSRRPDMPIGCDEKIDFSFYKYIWNYNKKILPIVLDSVKKYNLQDKFIHLKSKKEVLEFMKEIKGIYA